jgi:hypothetical protein
MKRLAVVAVVVALTVLAARFGPALYPDIQAHPPTSAVAPVGLDQPADEMAAIRRAFDEAADLHRQGRFDDAEDHWLVAARTSSELLYAKAAYQRGEALLTRAAEAGPSDQRGLLLKAELQFRDCLAREARALPAALFADARRGLEAARQRLAQPAPTPPPDSRSGEAKGPGDPEAPPASAKRGKPEATAPSAPTAPAAAEPPQSSKAASAPIMVGPDGVMYQPLLPDGRRPR